MPTTYLEAIREGIWEEMERDANVFLIGEDIGVYGGAFKMTTGFLERFGEKRVVDTPIAESAIVGAAIGASLMGLRPVAEIQFSDFITCGYDQIVNFAAKCRYRWGAGVPIVIRAPSGGGIHGGPFHSQNPEALFTHTPGLKIVAPSSAYDAKGLIKSAIRDGDPVLFFEHKALYRRIKEDLPSAEYTVPIGKASVVRQGKDLSIITYGAMVYAAREAAEALGAGRHLDRDRRSPHARPARRGHDSRKRPQDLQSDRPARSHADRRHRRRDRRPHCGESFRLPGWPGAANRRAGHTLAVQSNPRGSLSAERRRNHGKSPLAFQILATVR